MSNTKPKKSQPGQDIFRTPRNVEFQKNGPYKDLNTFSHEIRLLKIDPRSVERSGLINCELLQNQRLSDWHGRYTTISYCAGSALDIGKVLVDGVEFNVFANLLHSLTLVCQFWNANHSKSGTSQEELYLWADQICINQFNFLERSHQVAFMGEIYGAAAQVLVCLSDPATATYRDVLGWFHEIEENVPYVVNPALHDVVKESMLPELALEPYRSRAQQVPGFLDYQTFFSYIERTIDTDDFKRNWCSFMQIMQSRWWSRSWVLQEFLIPDQVHFLYGRESFAWERWAPLLSTLVEFWARSGMISSSFGRTINFGSLLECTASNCTGHQRYLARDIQVQSTLRRKHLWRGTQANDLKELLSKSSNCEASDARDLVYAFLALAPSYGIIPDYTVNNSLVHVLTETTQRIIERENSLEILHHAALVAWAPSVGIKHHQLPSWAFKCTKKEAESAGRAFNRFTNLEETSGIKFAPSYVHRAVRSHRRRRDQRMVTALQVEGVSLGSLHDLVQAERCFLLNMCYPPWKGKEPWDVDWRWLPRRCGEQGIHSWLNNQAVKSNITLYLRTHRPILMDDELWILTGSSAPLLLRCEEGDTFRLVAATEIRYNTIAEEVQLTPHTVRLLQPGRDYTKELRHISIA